MTDTMRYPLFSADSHVVEPPDLWLERLPDEFKHQAPQIESRDDGDYFVVPNTGIWLRSSTVFAPRAV